MEDDNNQNDLIVLDETENHEEKENQHNHNRNNIESDKLLEPQFEVSWEPNILNNLEPAISPTSPKAQQVKHGPVDDKQVKVKIKNLENDIADCKKMITMYDEAEVDLDSTTSSYIKSEK